MGATLDAVFIRSKEIDRLAKKYGDRVLHWVESCGKSAFVPVESWGAASTGDFTDYASDSSEYGEVVRLMGSNWGDDNFVYEHWKDGALVRRLRYYTGSGWLTVDGKEEEWESSLFGDAPVLDRMARVLPVEMVRALISHYKLPKKWPRDE